MNTQTPTLPSPDIQLQIEPAGRPQFPWVILICVWMLVLFTATLVTFVLPECFSSTARIRVERDQTDIPGLQGTAAATAYDPYFLQTEFELIKSEAILGRVINNTNNQNLNLNKRWGAKIAPQSGVARTYETIPVLRRMLALNTLRGTSLIEITVSISSTLEGGHAADEAAVLANAIAEAYKQYREEKRARLIEGGIAALKKAYESNLEEVHKAQLALATLARSQAAQDTNLMNEAAQKLEGLQRIGQALSAKVEVAKTDLLLPASSMVEIVEHAVPGIRPVSPNKSLNIALGMLVGVLAGFVLATAVFVLQWLAYRRRSGGSGLPPQLRIFIHILIALFVGLSIGYLLAVPLSLETFIGIPIMLLLGGGASAYIELARFQREAASSTGNP
jgi:uncharacterized protein involved in exopolysaccharide biosynthesis